MSLRKPVLPVKLDLPAAFDTADPSLLLKGLEQQVGLQGVVLQQFRSFLTDRRFPVMISDLSSTSGPLASGVPQGSTLGPVLFSLPTPPLRSIIPTHNVSVHLLADDLQIFLASSASFIK